ncbi:aquaporin-like protein [Aspergillus taichungensis]|uniref:Aquaporin-like protein n=1 Tax=Aspergillus taichungensis TaxID=482145 RepID=A0A2J5HJE8_9EURO|nr:aquaporin-like protein [Aspergillus taichungensis]
MILVLFGDGAIAQVTLSGGSRGNYQSISWAWGLGILLGTYTSTRSGSHLNPAITFTNCLLRPSTHPWSILPVYTLAQTLGAIIAATLIYANYHSAIDVHEGRLHGRSVPITSFSSAMIGSNAMAMSNATAGIFSTYPAPFMTRSDAFFSESLASAILMFLVFVSKDVAYPPPPPPPSHSPSLHSTDPATTNHIPHTNPKEETGRGDLILPLGLFFTVFGIGASFGWETGYAMNLARDFGPRLVSCMVGYGREVWTAGGYYFWIPMVAPFVGCIIGGSTYDLFLYAGTESPLSFNAVY